MTRVFCNGQPATVDDLAGPALRNDGHFTTFQLRDRAVHGLDLHLQRLDDASRALFDAPLPAARVLDGLRAALDASATRDASVRITVVPGAGEGGLDVLVSLSLSAVHESLPLRLRSVVHQRAFAAIKHAGTFPLFEHQRRARAAGADDALFVDAAGHVIEGSVWNVGLWDGAAITWPQADALRGTRERLLQAGLAALGVPQSMRPVLLDALRAPIAAFACNARGQRMIGSVDGHALALDPQLPALLEQALATRAPIAVDLPAD